MNARWSEEAERWVLGAILVDPGCLARLRAVLSPRDFYSSAHAEVYEAFCAAWDEHKALDMPLVHGELKARGKLRAVGGLQYLGGLTDEVTHTASVDANAKLVADHARCRRIHAAAAEAAAKACEASLSADAIAEHALRLITQAATTTRSTTRSTMEAAMAVWDRLATPPDQRKGLRTGLKALDTALGGLLPGQLVIAAARPGMGKSALSAQIALHVAKGGDTVGYWTLEMSAEEVVERLVRADAAVSVSQQTLSRVELDRVTGALQRISGLPIAWDDQAGLTASEICNRARALHARTPLSLVVVDHLALVEDPPGWKQGKVLAVGHATAQFKRLAKDLGIPVLVLHQLNRAVEGRTEKRPALSDLRDSGSVEQDADKVLLIYREAYYNAKMKGYAEEVEVIVAKQRNGATGTVKLRFVPSLTTFENIELDRHEAAVQAQSDDFESTYEYEAAE